MKILAFLGGLSVALAYVISIINISDLTAVIIFIVLVYFPKGYLNLRYLKKITEVDKEDLKTMDYACILMSTGSSTRDIIKSLHKSAKVHKEVFRRASVSNSVTESIEIIKSVRYGNLKKVGIALSNAYHNDSTSAISYLEARKKSILGMMRTDEKNKTAKRKLFSVLSLAFPLLGMCMIFLLPWLAHMINDISQLNR
ncbi:MAG: hypothetical protein N4A40_13300 [Tissierellales bacterium]|jgi:hypothetical protein|nr:hypothetical protein [Tissierellales bacterium]